jgi:hypothetical protein
MPDTDRLAELHGRCTRPPSDMPLMGRLAWEPPQSDVEALMDELDSLLTSTQKRLLFDTCAHFEDHWEWLSWGDVDAGARRCLRGDAVSYVLRRSGGRVVGTELGRWFYDHQTGGAIREQMDRLNPSGAPSL